MKYLANETWKCLYGQYRVPLIKNPYLMVASQYDSYQLGNNVNRNPPFDENTLIYVNKFANITQKLLTDLISQGKYGISYYSWACFNHDTSEDLSFNKFALFSGVTLKQALESYLNSLGFFSNEPTKKTESWIDLCEGFSCGICAPVRYFNSLE